MHDARHWTRAFDLDGDGRPDEILPSFSGGAHCCYELTVRLSSTGEATRLPFSLEGGYAAGLTGQDRAPSFDEMILERFVRKQPIAAGLRVVLERLFDASEINDLFERHRVRQYSGKILFAAVVQVMLAVVSRKVDSAHAAMQAHGDDLGASVTAFYNTINGTHHSDTARHPAGVHTLPTKYGAGGQDARVSTGRGVVLPIRTGARRPRVEHAPPIGRATRRSIRPP
jgi:hypothetical protein